MPRGELSELNHNHGLILRLKNKRKEQRLASKWEFSANETKKPRSEDQTIGFCLLYALVGLKVDGENFLNVIQGLQETRPGGLKQLVLS